MDGDKNLSGVGQSATNQMADEQQQKQRADRIHAAVDMKTTGYTTQQGREEDAARAKVRQIIRDRRLEFHNSVQAVLHRLGVFSGALTEALGDVTADEAVRALQTDANRMFETLRRAIQSHE